jgi:hypothetical protein
LAAAVSVPSEWMPTATQSVLIVSGAATFVINSIAVFFLAVDAKADVTARFGHHAEAMHPPAAICLALAKQPARSSLYRISPSCLRQRPAARVTAR